MQSRLNEITVVECTEQDELIRCGGQLYVLKNRKLRVRLIEEQQDMVLAGHSV